MRLELFQQQIAWNLQNDIRYKEDDQHDVVFYASQNVKLFSESIYYSIGYVDTIKER